VYPAGTFDQLIVRVGIGVVYVSAVRSTVAPAVIATLDLKNAPRGALLMS
jgi:hypothetical protein